MIDKMYIILDACTKVYGSDFTKKTRKRQTIYARAAFINIVRTKYGKKVSLESIGRVVGGLDHATVLHALNKTIEAKNGSYLLEKEFTDILYKFNKSIKNILALKDSDEIKVYANDLVGTIERLEDEADNLKGLIYKMNLEKIEALRNKDRSFVDDIFELPATIKQEFYKFKWLPYKKMLESRKHYDFEINNKPVY
tara:strand:+ start:273 stop:860 length:588 start_codon:yes stop_codon:yes gene_type:complete